MLQFPSSAPMKLSPLTALLGGDAGRHIPLRGCPFSARKREPTAGEHGTLPAGESRTYRAKPVGARLTGVPGWLAAGVPAP